MSSYGFDSKKFSNISATTAAFGLTGGRYVLIATATWGGGNAVVQALAGDGTTYVAMHTALTADGTVAVDLPAGTYRLAVTTATALYATLTAVKAS